MKIGIISDIHSNLEAFSEALVLLNASKVERIYCCGDIVGYGPNPNECVDLVREKGITSIKGNHDFGAVDREQTKNFNSYAKVALDWTRDILSLENTSFLGHLNLFLYTEELTFFHGSLLISNPFLYIVSEYEAWISLNNLPSDIGFFGHSHIPGVFSLESEYSASFVPARKGLKVILEKGKKYIINVGSVGQPRDGNPDGALAIFDTETRALEIKRFSYDIEKTFNKIKEANLPSFLGERLFVGV